jgi:hypothetical protein
LVFWGYPKPVWILILQTANSATSILLNNSTVQDTISKFCSWMSSSWIASSRVAAFKGIRMVSSLNLSHKFMGGKYPAIFSFRQRIINNHM